MARSKKRQEQKHKKRYTPTVIRWAKRKAEESAEALEQRIQGITDAGGRKKFAVSFTRMKAAQALAWRKEREMLATTSLKDLVK
jgi:hypothetical protein